MSGLGLPFKVFLLVGLLAAWRQRRRSTATAALHAFLALGVLGCVVPIITQRDNWPFSAWPLVAALAPDSITQERLVAMDAAGREHEIDHRAWYPIDFGELVGWLRGPFQDLSEAERAAAFAHLLDKAERARLRALARGLGGRGLLGPFETPPFVLHRRRWTEPARTPPTSFAALRLYRETWGPEQRARDGRVLRRLVYEHSRVGSP